MRISPTLALAAALALVMPAPDLGTAQAQPAGCPPGLAKKNPPCVPPGLAKKGEGARSHDGDRLRYVDRDDDHDHYVRWSRDDGERFFVDDQGRLWRYSLERGDYFIDEDGYIWRSRDGRVYRRGDRLEGVDYRYLTPRELARLPLLEDGRTYVRVDNEVLEVMEAGNLFFRTVGAFDALLN